MMIVTIKYFGLIAEVTNKSEEQLQLDQETISVIDLKSKLESLTKVCKMLPMLLL